MREHIEADEPFVREDVPVARGARALPRRGPGLQGRADRGPRRATRASRPSRSTRNGPFTDLCRGPHAPDAPSASGVQAAVGRRRLLARRRRPPDAHAHLRHRVLQARRSSRRTSSGSRRRARATTASSAASSACSRSPTSRPGSPFWLPQGHGAVQRARRARRARMQRRARLRRGQDAAALRRRAVEDLGHWDKYRENMFVAEVEDREFGLKPMNCPGHCQLYGPQRALLPRPAVRYAEAGPAAPPRAAAARCTACCACAHFTQDDAHIFCTEDQIEDEVARCLDFGVRDLRRCSASRSTLELSTRPEKRLGNDEIWDHAEGALGAALESDGPRVRRQRGRRRVLRAEDRPPHDRLARPLVAARHGPARLQRCPSASSSTYTGADNAEHRPVMIHRALLGSFERFIGILIEHYAGEFPLWLAPVQAIVLPIADRHNDYARRGRARALRAAGAARRGRRAHRVGRAQDPRRRAAQDPLHARGRRPRGRGRARSRVRRHGEGDDGTRRARRRRRSGSIATSVACRGSTRTAAILARR